MITSTVTDTGNMLFFGPRRRTIRRQGGKRQARGQATANEMIWGWLGGNDSLSGGKGQRSLGVASALYHMNGEAATTPC